MYLIIFIIVLFIILCFIKSKEYFHIGKYNYLMSPHIDKRNYLMLPHIANAPYYQRNNQYYQGTDRYASNPGYLGYHKYYKDSFNLGFW